MHYWVSHQRNGSPQPAATRNCLGAMIDDTSTHDTVSSRPRDFDLGLFWVVPDAVAVADADSGRIVLWNPAAEALFGYSSSEAFDLAIEALVPDPVRRELRAGLARSRGADRPTVVGSPERLEVPALRKTGEAITVELTLSPVAGATVGGCFVLAVMRERTERGRTV